jgi:hypothetical protein
VEFFFQVALAVWLGWLVTLQSLNWVVQWLWGIWTQIKVEPGKRSAAAVVAAALLVPAPWVVTTLVALSVKFGDSWWAIWVVAGAGLGLVSFGWAVVEARRRGSRESHR